jgi:hypothetical protein
MRVRDGLRCWFARIELWRDADGEYGSYRAHEVSEIHEIVARRTVTYTAEHYPGALPGWD